MPSDKLPEFPQSQPRRSAVIDAAASPGDIEPGLPCLQIGPRAGPPSDLPASLPPNLPASLPVRAACRVVRQMVSELMALLADRVMLRRDRRRYACHVRQISMYVCHVTLRIPMGEIGEALGRDRTTVGHACHVVEDRRDDPAFDDLVSSVERIVGAVFGLLEVPAHD